MPARCNTISWNWQISQIALAALFVAGGWLRQASAEDSQSPTADTSAAASATKPANAVVLAYKFQAGQFAHYTGVNRVQYNSQLPAQKGNGTIELEVFSSVQSNETWNHFRVVTVDEQGLALIEPVIDRTRMVAKLHDKPPVVFDSKDKTNSQPEFKTIQEAIGRTIARFQVASTGKLVKVIIVDATAPQAMIESAQKLETRFPYLSILPTNPVSVGDKWREEFSVMAGNDALKQAIPMRRIFELTGIADGIAVIKFKTLAMIPINDPELSKQLIQQTPTGSIEFDIERGLVRSYTSHVNQTAINAFGNQTLLQVVGESTEKLVVEDAVAVSAVKATGP